MVLSKEQKEELRRLSAALNAATPKIMRDRAQCTCHNEPTEKTHEMCCGHPEGRSPNCPLHGDGSSE
jgi:hypothetical protein